MQTLNHQEKIVTIQFPVSHAYELCPWGASIGADVPEHPERVYMTLPSGWTTDWGTRHGIPMALRDQHGRLRATVDWTARMVAEGGDYVYYDTLDGATIVSAEAHAFAVAEHGEQLVIDSWAEPHKLIAAAAERIHTFTLSVKIDRREIEKWRERQPDHADNLRSKLADHQQKLDNWTALYERVAQELLTGAASARDERSVI